VKETGVLELEEVGEMKGSEMTLSLEAPVKLLVDEVSEKGMEEEEPPIEFRSLGESEKEVGKILSFEGMFRLRSFRLGRGGERLKLSWDWD